MAIPNRRELKRRLMVIIDMALNLALELQKLAIEVASVSDRLK